MFFLQLLQEDDELLLLTRMDLLSPRKASLLNVVFFYVQTLLHLENYYPATDKPLGSLAPGAAAVLSKMMEDSPLGEETKKNTREESAL